MSVTMKAWGTILFAAVVILCICVCVIVICKYIARKKDKQIFAPKIFAVTNICIGLFIWLYAAYDAKTSIDGFDGIYSMLVLIFTTPVIVIYLLADIIYIIWKRRR